MDEDLRNPRNTREFMAVWSSSPATGPTRDRNHRRPETGLRRAA